MFKPQAAGLLHLFFLHLGHALSGEVEPFARAHNAVLRFVIRDRRFQAFFDQSISEQAVAELGSFECRLITLRAVRMYMPFSISKLRQSFRVHWATPLFFRLECLT